MTITAGKFSRRTSTLVERRSRIVIRVMKGFHDFQESGDCGRKRSSRNHVNDENRKRVKLKEKERREVISPD